MMYSQKWPSEYGSTGGYQAVVDKAEASAFERPDLRKEFSKRRSQRIKEHQKEQPVFGTLFRRKAPSKNAPKSKSRENSFDIDPNDAGTNEAMQPLKGRSAPSRKSTKMHHSFLYSMLSPHSKRWQAIAFKHFITLIIMTDLVLFILSTDETFLALSDEFYRKAEGFASTIFLLEYLGRVLTITEKQKYRAMGAVAGRLAYARTFSALIDLIAALPFFLEIPTGWNLPTLTYVRFIRLFRILKTEDYMRSLDAVYRVVWFNRQILYVATLVCVLLVLITSILLYYCRPPKDDAASAQFDSLGETMFISTLMLTGGGGPDTDNLPWYTKAVVLLTSVFSVAMFAIPASMLTWGFEAEAERMAKQARKQALKRREKKRQSSEGGSQQFSCSSSSSSDYESDGGTTDEEYFQLISGLDPPDEDETPAKKILREKFEKADADRDGTLTLKEFQEIQEVSQVGASLESGVFLERLERLEKEVEKNSKTLGRILALLEQQQQKK